MAILTTAAIPYFIRQAETVAAQKVAEEVSTIQDAARLYYLTNGAWPDSIPMLKDAGFLSPFWPAVNPWGGSYSISSTPTILTVATILPGFVGGVLARALPGVSSSPAGNNLTVASTIPSPGQQASIKLVEDTANKALEMAMGSAVPPHGDIIAIRSDKTKSLCPTGYVAIRAGEGGGEHNLTFWCQSIARQ
ncbi:MAG: hypothetical protein HY695_24565 [Deltaproteobacteria bacterium]|nr:hypothetical protein [Deltaproteobacteria bacterium]